MSADMVEKILSSDWLVSLKPCSDWLDRPFKRRISKVEQTDKQIHLISCWTAYFLVKYMLGYLKREQTDSCCFNNLYLCPVNKLICLQFILTNKQFYRHYYCINTGNFDHLASKKIQQSCNIFSISLNFAIKIMIVPL